MTQKPPTALERARKIVAAWWESHSAPAVAAATRSGSRDNDSDVACTLAALTSAHAERDAVIEDCAKLAEGKPSNGLDHVGLTDAFRRGQSNMKSQIAAAIRAMKTGGA